MIHLSAGSPSLFQWPILWALSLFQAQAQQSLTTGKICCIFLSFPFSFISELTSLPPCLVQVVSLGRYCLLIGREPEETQCPCFWWDSSALKSLSSPRDAKKWKKPKQYLWEQQDQCSGLIFYRLMLQGVDSLLSYKRVRRWQPQGFSEL